MFAMSTEAPPKRESYTWWIVAVAALLVIAVGVPIAGSYFRPLEIRIDLSDGTTNSVAWTCELDGERRIGTTNLPVTMVFKGRKVDFSAKPVALGPPLTMRFQWEYYVSAHHTVVGRDVRVSGNGRHWTASAK